MAPLTVFAIPCQQCDREVTVYSSRPHEYIRAWLDGHREIRCALHRE